MGKNTEKFGKKKFDLGIDISKDTLDCALLDAEGAVKDLHVPNTIKGYERIINWLEQNKVSPKEVLFCMEHTGTYGLMLFAWLSDQEIDYCVESGIQIKRSLGLVRGKNDKVDARRIAEYSQTHRSKLSPFKLPGKVLMQVKQLLTYRDQNVRIRTSLKNSLKNHRQYQQITDLKVSEQIEERIEEMNKIISEIEVQIVKLLEEDESVKRNFEFVKSVTGIGLIIGAYMIVTTNNFTSFTNSRKYSCYVGTAPFEHTSGTSIRGRTRTSPYANKKMKTLFASGANIAIRHDNQLKAYYKRKREEGKDHKVIINAISCKLIDRAFAVVKRQQPFVKNMYEYNFS